MKTISMVTLMIQIESTVQEICQQAWIYPPESQMGFHRKYLLCHCNISIATSTQGCLRGGTWPTRSATVPQYCGIHISSLNYMHGNSSLQLVSKFASLSNTEGQSISFSYAAVGSAPMCTIKSK